MSVALTARQRGLRQTDEREMSIRPDLLSRARTAIPSGTAAEQEFTGASSLTRFGMRRLSELSSAVRQTICWLQEPLPTLLYFRRESLLGTLSGTLRIRNVDNVCLSRVAMCAAVSSAPNSSGM